MSQPGLRYGQGYERRPTLVRLPATRLERAARAACRVRGIDPDECMAFEPGRGCTLRRWQTQVALVEAVLGA